MFQSVEKEGTMEKEGSKSVPIIDKRQITAVFAGTMFGMFLSPQLIYRKARPMHAYQK